MKQVLLYILFFLLAVDVLAQSVAERQLDSLVSVFRTIDDDDSRWPNMCYDIGRQHYNLDSSLLYSKRLLDYAEDNSDYYYESLALYLEGYVDYFNGEYDHANELLQRALNIATSHDYDSIAAIVNVSIGLNYSYLGNYPSADIHYGRALDYFTQTSDSAGISLCYNSLASNYSQQRLWGRAESLYRNALRIDSLRGYKYGMSEAYQHLADMYLFKYLTSTSKPDLELIKKGKYSLFHAMSLYYDEPYTVFSICFTLSYFIYIEAVSNNLEGDKLKDAVDFLQMLYSDGLDALKRMDVDTEELLFEYTHVNLLLLSHKYDEAKAKLDSITDIVLYDESLSDKLPYLYVEYDFYYQAIGDFRKAYYHKSRFYELCNDEASMEYIASSVRTMAENEFRQAEIQRQERRKRIMSYWVIGVSLFLLFLVFEFVRKVRHNRQLNEKNLILQNQTEEILQQKEEINAQKDELFERSELISEKNKQITDSIHYASLIQMGALPRPEDMQQLFHEYFVIFRPLNIVAGDFYWASQQGRYSILVCADCTGHGVPGAFVSMLGISLLNEVTASISDHTLASDILNTLRDKLMKSLRQSKKKYENGVVYSMDGIDMSMVMIDYKAMSLQYAGAYRPLWIWRRGELIIYKPDKMPIGLYLGPEKNFTNHIIDIEKGDVLYMFSDGIPDQFGYVDDTHTVCKHFSTRKLENLVREIGELPLQKQKQRVEHEVDTWKNGYKQLDDNIMIGVRI